MLTADVIPSVKSRNDALLDVLHAVGKNVRYIIFVILPNFLKIRIISDILRIMREILLIIIDKYDYTLFQITKNINIATLYVILWNRVLLSKHLETIL